jgi:hypothetical protein
VSLLTERQRRHAARTHRRKSGRNQDKIRQKLEKAMRDNGSLGRLTAVQAALRRKDISEKIHARVREHETFRGQITQYEVLRAIVQLVLSEEGFALEGVMIKFSFGPGCGACNHPHDKDCGCGYPGCICKTWKPAQLLGIMAAPTPDAIKQAAHEAGVEHEIDNPV